MLVPPLRERGLGISSKTLLCVVLDFRRLNEITDRDTYPLPKVDENLAKLGKAKLFTTCDLLMGFHQVELEPDLIPRTAFSTHTHNAQRAPLPKGSHAQRTRTTRNAHPSPRGLPKASFLHYSHRIRAHCTCTMHKQPQDQRCNCTIGSSSAQSPSARCKREYPALLSNGVKKSQKFGREDVLRA